MVGVQKLGYCHDIAGYIVVGKHNPFGCVGGTRCKQKGTHHIGVDDCLGELGIAFRQQGLPFFQEPGIGQHALAVFFVIEADDVLQLFQLLLLTEED